MENQKYNLNGKIVTIATGELVTLKDENGFIGHILKSDFEKEAKLINEERKLPESWEEFCKIKNKSIPEYTIIRNTFEHRYESHIRLYRLIEYYNDGWKPDWRTDRKEAKHCLILSGNKFNHTDQFHYNSQFICLKTKELYDHFVRHHLELIKQAAPVIWGVKPEQIK